MGSTVEFIKTLIPPAAISLLLFLVTSYVLVPLWRRYRARYAQYLPLPTESSLGAVPLHRYFGRALNFTWFRQRFSSTSASESSPYVGGAIGSAISDDDLSDEGEELGEVGHQWGAARTDSLQDPFEPSRLSRMLEEGFRDDSEDEADGGTSRLGSAHPASM